MVKKIAYYPILATLLTWVFASGICFADRDVPRYSIRKGHPRLYITQDRIGDIRKRCAFRGGSQAKYYSVLKDFGDKFSEEKYKPSPYYCLCLAFLHILGEVPGHDYSQRSIGGYGNLAIAMLKKIRPPDKDLSYFARYTPWLIACYDWLFNAMSEDQRAQIFENFSVVCDQMKEALRKPIGNQFRGTREMYGFYGLAFYDDGVAMYPDDPQKASMVDQTARNYCDFFANWQIGQNLAVFEIACKEGAYPDGTMYGEAPYPGRLWPLHAWDTASSGNLYKNMTCLTGFPLFWLYQMLPFRSGVRYDTANGRIDQPGGLVRFGDYRYIGYTQLAGKSVNKNIAQAQGIAASQGESNLAALYNWMIQYQGDFTFSPFGGPFPEKKWIGAGPDLVWDIIFRNGLDEAKSPEEVKLPLAFHFGSTDSGPPLPPDFSKGRPEGAGVVVMRSGWEDQEGTVLWFKASSHMLSHSHRDQGSFQIYKKGWLAIDSGQYEETSHRGNYSVRTVAHNSLLVYDPEESLQEKKVDPVWYGYGNDGGQRWIGFVKTAEDVLDEKHFLGGVRRFESVPGVYDYAHADITRAYNSTLVTTEGHDPKVSLVNRSIFYLRPDEYIVVFDRVISTKSEYPKRWVLHSVYRPDLDGKESFNGEIPFSDQIPGKRQGVKLRGSMEGGISESRDTTMITLRAWNFGSSDGRLVCRTLLPKKHLTRVVGGGDELGVIRSRLARQYQKGSVIFVKDTKGFEVGDFVYLGETDAPYSKGTYGSPNWPVDDVFYKGWGKVSSIDRKENSITMVPYRYAIPNLPEGTVVVRSDHGNKNSFEFMDAEYNQWEMQGEAVANAGPFNMQHGAWRTEIEPIEKNKKNFFLHVMLPCDSGNVKKSKEYLKDNLQLHESGDAIQLTVKGNRKEYGIVFQKNNSGETITTSESGRRILENNLTEEAIAKRKNERPGAD